MAGDATFAGTTFQARLLAFADVHVLAQSPLGWIPNVNDTPVAVSGETLGPGDDVRIEFAGGHPPIEAQAKHGLNAAGDLDEVVARLHAGVAALSGGAPGLPPAPGAPAPSPHPAPPHVAAPSGGPAQRDMRVVLVVDRGSTRALYTEFAEDLTRLRSGRDDGARPTLRRLLAADAGLAAQLQRLFVVAVDLDHGHQPEAKHALVLLRSVLEDPTQAAAAWDILAADANDVCARRLRRDRPALVDLLAARGIAVRPPPPDERWMRQLDFTRDLLHRRHAAVALARLRQLAADLRAASRGTPPADPQVHYRLAQQEAGAYRRLGRHREALDAAERALDYVPTGVHALAEAAAAAADLGDLTVATGYATRAVGAHPLDAIAWGAQVQVARLSGDAPADVPTEVRTTEHFRQVQTHMAMAAGDWGEALRLTAELMAGGDRSDGTLYMRMQALANAHASAGAAETADGRLGLREAERLASELIDQLADETDPFTGKTYIVRAHARRQLGRPDEADADLAHARRIDSDDPDALWHTATSLIDRGQEPEALALLRHPAVDADARLLSLRARLLVDQGQPEEARVELAAVGRLEPVPLIAYDVHARVAETALLLGDVTLARDALARVPPERRDDALVLHKRARLAVAEGDVDVGVALYRAAALANPADRLGYLGEAADTLRRAGRATDAVPLFEEAIGITPLGSLPDDLSRSFAVALLSAHRLVRAQELVDALLARGTVPAWGLALATELAISRDDVEQAIAHLEALATRDGSNPQVRIDLARWLLEVGRVDEARAHIAWLRGLTTPTPELRMATAELLDASGATEEALPLAFRAFRDGGDRPAMHRAFVTLVLTARSSPPRVDEVGPDTHVRLRRNDGTLRRVTVLAEPPIDPRRDELSVDDARAADLLGRRVGDIVVRHAGGWNQGRWTVEGLLPAIQFAAMDAAQHFAERFPGEPFFIAGFSVAGEGPEALAPILASLEERKAHVTHVFEVYRDSTLPLGFVAQVTGGTLVGVMRYLSHELRANAAIWAPSAVVTAGAEPGTAVSGSPPPWLAVEWGDKDGQHESHAAARDARELVLTRSAIETLEQLDLLPLLAPNYTLVAPRSLRELLRREVQEAEAHLRDGYKQVATGPGGLSLIDLEPAHAALQQARDRAAARLAWLSQAVAVAPRPLETVPPAGSREAEAREAIGADSLDAVDLVKHRGSTMYSDDLGLRRFFTRGAAGRSCSTVGLLAALVDRGVLSPEARDGHLLRLVEWRYVTVPVSASLLELAVQRAATLSPATMRAAFGLLALGGTTLDEAARIVGHVLLRLATAPLHVVGVGGATDLALGAMGGRWAPGAVAVSIRRAAADALRLLPLDLQTVDARCAQFAREGRVASLTLPGLDPQ